MSRDVVPQVDIGALSLRGLTALTPLLSALSADDVAPSAMIQLGTLGSLFHVNGQYALMVPDLLRRCSSVRLDRIGLMIGWRKGDTASVLAQSGGGQAVALMCFCLINSCRTEDLGVVLDDLCNRIIPQRVGRSSLDELMKLANLLAAKLQPIGFGNLLAKQVMIIQKVYSHIKCSVPPEFFHSITRESLVELYCALSRLSEEDVVVRISGLHGMSYVMMAVLIMFPDNVTITTNSLLIRQGCLPSIFLNIDTTRTSPTSIQVEEKLTISPCSQVLVETTHQDSGEVSLQCRFKWTGHVVDVLRISFASAGAGFSKALVEACCDIILHTVKNSSQETLINGEHQLSVAGSAGFLGTDPILRCYQVCQVVFGSTPTGHHPDSKSAYSKLISIVNAVAGPLNCCECKPSNDSDTLDEWECLSRATSSSTQPACPRQKLWRFLDQAMSRTYCALLVEADADATTTFDARYSHFLSILQPGIVKIRRLASPDFLRLPFSDCFEIHRCIMALIEPIIPLDGWKCRYPSLAISNGASTIYPSSLNSLSFNVKTGLRYYLKDGQLRIKGRPYNELTSTDMFLINPFQLRPEPVSEPGDCGRPSNIGEHSDIKFTIEGFPNQLHLRTSVLVRGHSLSFDLCEVICSSMTLEDAPECHHSLMTELTTDLQKDVSITCVGTEQPEDGKIAIVQTKDNPTAQLLACEPVGGLLLQRKSCLNCAVAYAKTHNLKRIIVAC